MSLRFKVGDEVICDCPGDHPVGVPDGKYEVIDIDEEDEDLPYLLKGHDGDEMWADCEFLEPADMPSKKPIGKPVGGISFVDDGLRKPVGVSVIPFHGRTITTVVCDDGSVWFIGEDSRWTEGRSIPGTRREHEQDDEACKKAECAPVEMSWSSSFNINVMVSVVLTEHGLKLWKAEYGDVGLKKLNGNVLDIELWMIMRCFGSDMSMGAPSCFENNRIEVIGNE